MKTASSEQARLLRWQSAVGMVGMVGLPVARLWYPELVFYAAHMGRSPQVWPDPIPPKHSVAGITRYDTRGLIRLRPRCNFLAQAGMQVWRQDFIFRGLIMWGALISASDKGGLKKICAMLSPFTA